MNMKKFCSNCLEEVKCHYYEREKELKYNDKVFHYLEKYLMKLNDSSDILSYFKNALNPEIIDSMFKDSERTIKFLAEKPTNPLFDKLINILNTSSP